MSTAGEAPKRIQRKRTKGWKMPPNTVYVGRPTIWGNPFRVGMFAKIGDGREAMCYLVGLICGHGANWRYIGTVHQAVNAFRELRQKYPLSYSELRGKDLACWCPLNQPCHADVLLEIANS